MFCFYRIEDFLIRCYILSLFFNLIVIKFDFKRLVMERGGGKSAGVSNFYTFRFLSFKVEILDKIIYEFGLYILWGARFG